ncbi:MAG: GNAT family N-acetyltransferase [Ferruginibacter sp.]|nr:GNAT family N-acetyltransferase [Ferruginibacter sp.]
MGLKQIDHGSVDYQKMIQLRYKILRQPIGLNFTEQELNAEKDDILIGAFDEEDMTGCCVLCKVDDHVLRLRQMAVDLQMQHNGVGASIMSFAENLARDKGCKKIILHARKPSVGFYEKFGFEQNGEEFIELNLPHVLMEKKI